MGLIIIHSCDFFQHYLTAADQVRQLLAVTTCLHVKTATTKVRLHSDINANSEVQSEVTGNGSASNNQIPETKQCNECEETFSSKEELKQHFENEHSFSCTMCNSNGSTQITMERHILDAHVKKNKSGKFTCDECSIEVKTKEELWDHYQKKHKLDESNNAISTDKDSSETCSLKSELKALKSNFKRLEGLFKDTLDEGEKTKAEYQAKLLEATEEVRVLKSDNTALKERIDILYKLAKSYLDRFEPSTSDRTPEQEKKVVISDEVEVLEDSRSTTPSLNAWTKSKVRGFKKTSPLSPNTEQEQIEDNGSSNVMQDIQPHQVNDQSRKTSDSPDQTSDSNSVKSYCHFFSNYGHCAC